MRSLSEQKRFYLNQVETNRSCFLAFRDIILKQHETIHETRKYGMPCFCFIGKPMCYLWTDKKTNATYILFVDGNRLEHPSLESGNLTKMKVLRIEPKKDQTIKELKRILSKALKLRDIT